MKKPALLLVLVLALLGGYFVASPYLALKGLGQALDSGDQSALEEHVDFPALRQNLKEQLNVAFARQLGDSKSDHPLAGFAATLAGAFMDPVIDAFVTPAGMSQLLRGNARRHATNDANNDAGNNAGNTGGNEATGSAPQDGSGNATADTTPDPFAEADTAFESASRFRVTLHQADGDKLDLFLRREGLSWKLYRIDLPLEAFGKAAASE